MTRLALLALALSIPPGLSRADAPPVASQVPGVNILALAALPPAPPADADARDACAHLFLDPATAPGRDVAAKGWAVTGEAPFGPYTAVSFVGGMEPATSGTCALSQGNVALFAGATLRAIIFASDDAGQAIGSLRPFGQGGLRILTGDLIPAPLADLRMVGADGVAVTPVALDEPVCGGRGTVPLIEGLPVDMARALLFTSGWASADLDHGVDRGPMATEIAAAGVPEVVDCSGTGFGFCAYSFAGAAGQLDVQTAGEPDGGRLPLVTGYGVTCAP
jgi:hypothetical protein